MDCLALRFYPKWRISKPCSAWPVYAPPILQGQQVCGLVAVGVAKTLPEWIAACTACEHDHRVEHHRNAVAE
jgi:hypothetical protein